jgi:hypothetical protein
VSKKVYTTHLVALERPNPVSCGAISQHGLGIFAGACKKVAICSWKTAEVPTHRPTCYSKQLKRDPAYNISPDTTSQTIPGHCNPPLDTQCVQSTILMSSLCMHRQTCVHVANKTFSASAASKVRIRLLEMCNFAQRSNAGPTCS